MRVVFLGSGRFAEPSLEALVAAGHQLVAVVTQPDRPSGRGRAPQPPPLKPAAIAHGLRVLQPARVRTPEAVELLRGLAADLHVVVAYGQILPKALLEVPPRGTVNVHGSLLPSYRGAAPVQWAIANGERESGVTTMLLDEGLDTGPMLLSRREAIAPDDTAATLEPRLARIGAGLLIETLAGLATGTLAPRPQDPALASYAPLLKKDDGRVRWADPAVVIERKVRAFDPWPGATASLGGRSLKLLKTRVEAGSVGAPGTLLAADAAGLLVACGEGSALRLLELQPESRRPMPAAAFAAGARLSAGQRFD